MKKPVTFIVITIAAIYLIILIFSYYNSTHILSDQAVFKVYLDLKESNIDSFFGQKKGTYDKEKYSIICQLPVNVVGAKSVFVNFNINSIDCDHVYNDQIDKKYDNSELDGNYFKLVMIKGGFPVSLFDADLPIFRNTIIAYKDVPVDYNKGKINNIVITADSAYNYCTNTRK